MFRTKLFMAERQCIKLTKPCRADTAEAAGAGVGKRDASGFRQDPGSARTRGYYPQGYFPAEHISARRRFGGYFFFGGCLGFFFFVPAMRSP
jgi:hypothetical protein